MNELMPMPASGCENDYHHIFDNPEHHLDGYLAACNGNQAEAYSGVQTYGQTYVNTYNLTGVNTFTTNVRATNNTWFRITIRGRVINRKLNIGTFYLA